jgi:hypothetical protein
MVGLIGDYLDVPEHEKMDNFPEFKSLTVDSHNLKIQAHRLFKCVKEADWDEMAKMITDEKQDAWTLMIHPVSHVLADGETVECITPLKYTAKIFDKYSRELLLSYVDSSKTDDFWKHVAEQNEFIDLPLFKAYEEYEEICERCINGKAARSKAVLIPHIVYLYTV